MTRTKPILNQGVRSAGIYSCVHPRDQEREALSIAAQLNAIRAALQTGLEIVQQFADMKRGLQ